MNWVSTCCCGCSLRAGVIIIAVFEVVFVAAYVIAFAIKGSFLNYGTDEIVVSVVCAVILVNCLCMSVAAWKKIVPLLHVAAFVQFLVTAYFLFEGILKFRMESYVEGSISVCISLLFFYYFIVMTSLPKEINDLRLATGTIKRKP